MGKHQLASVVARGKREHEAREKRKSKERLPKFYRGAGDGPYEAEADQTDQ